MVIFSSKIIPGNERTVGRVINALYRLGAFIPVPGVNTEAIRQIDHFFVSVVQLPPELRRN